MLTLGEVKIPVGMERVGLSFDLDMPPDRSQSRIVEAVLRGSVRGEHPVSGSYAVQIPIFHPPGTLVGMSSLGPSPEDAKDDSIDPFFGRGPFLIGGRKMIVVEKISEVALLLLNAAKDKTVLPYSDFHSVFDKKTLKNDRYDTLESASRALSDLGLPIYSAVLAKSNDGCPGDGFYDAFNNRRHNEFMNIAGHNDIHKLRNEAENRKKIADFERVLVYEHAEKFF